jgi:hypothetical protein
MRLPNGGLDNEALIGNPVYLCLAEIMLSKYLRILLTRPQSHPISHGRIRHRIRTD